MPRSRGFTLIEVAACVVAIAVLCLVIAVAGRKALENSALAVASNNVRQLSVGAAQYLADNNYRYWLTVKDGYTVQDSNGVSSRGAQWWYGFETNSSRFGAGEGNRTFDSSLSPLAGYLPAAIRPDPSFSLQGQSFKPKYKSGYIGVGYNAVLGGGRMNSSESKVLSYWTLSDPARVAVFATCAQVNTFQAPASASHPMIEEFPYFDERETTIHFLQGNVAMVGFADGSAGFLPMDKSTRVGGLRNVTVGRFAPAGSFKYLK
jgi:prepilin-type N-terminal cleavage/methylation domain-containing protein